MLHQDIERILFSEEELKARVAELGAQIDRDYANQTPLLISVLRGSFIFMADLVRSITRPCTVDFMAVSSYGSGTTSSGQVKIVKDLSEQIEGRDIIVVEDILDSGNTLSYLFQLLQARHPASIRLCTLLDKPSRRTKAGTSARPAARGTPCRLHQSRTKSSSRWAAGRRPWLKWAAYTVQPYRSRPSSRRHSRYILSAPPDRAHSTPAPGGIRSNRKPSITAPHRRTGRPGCGTR